MPTENVNMNFHKIRGLKDPTENLDGVNKQYLVLMLDWKTFDFLNESAQEDLNMNTRQIVNLGQPTELERCVTKQYVDRLTNCLRSELLARAATSAQAFIPQPDDSTPSTTE